MKKKAEDVFFESFLNEVEKHGEYMKISPSAFLKVMEFAKTAKKNTDFNKYIDKMMQMDHVDSEDCGNILTD